MTKKCAIISLYGNNNYGNKLQNYAVFKILSDLNFDVEIIRYQEYNKYFNWYEKIFKIFNIKYLINKVLKKSNEKKYYIVSKQREKLFLDFNKNMSYSKFVVKSRNEVKRLNNIYDYFVFGSDQIWNVSALNFYELAFGTYFDKSKKISFSASFGRNSIPKKYISKYSEALKNFNAISVRENEGKQIIEDLTNRTDAIVLLDPTMLLSVSEWDKIMNRPVNFVDDDYVLLYFLGNISPKIKSVIDEFSIKNKLKVINLLDKDSKYYISGPSEFLYFIKHASFICTDSFHSTVFSILFEKPFIVFDRTDEKVSMFSRINTLLRKFNLENRIFNGVLDESFLDCDFAISKKVLVKEKAKALSYLTKFLH